MLAEKALTGWKAARREDWRGERTERWTILELCASGAVLARLRLLVEVRSKLRAAIDDMLAANGADAAAAVIEE